MATRFQPLPTPNPNEWKFVVWVDMYDLNPGSLPTVGTTYSSWALHPKDGLDINSGWGSYIFLDTMSGPPGQVGFIFGKAHSAQEKATAFRSHITYDEVEWPAVLLALGFITDSSAPMQWYSDASFTTLEKRPRPFVRSLYQPSVRTDTKILVEEFLSSTEYSSTDLAHEVPIPSEVNWDFLGTQGVYEKCLHPRIVLKEQQPKGTVLQDAGTDNAPRVFGSNQNLEFPATNFPTWRAYTLKDSQKYVEGQWHRIKLTAYPPRLPYSRGVA